jgi:SAM-dependent methyltransferase
MSRLTDWMDRTLYPQHGRNWDDVIFRGEIAARLRPELHVLDLGAGAGIVKQMAFRGQVARVCGVDLDPRVTSNPHLDEARVGRGEAIPWPDASFDLVFCDNVLEHLPDPVAVFREVRRVLRPGGLFLAKTPNRWHYVAVLASLTPYRFHRYYNRLRGRQVEDTFPTLYRANTRRALARHAERAGLRLVECHLVEGRPEYLRLTAPSYAAGWLYERLVNATPLLERFRCVLIAVLQRPFDGARESSTAPLAAARGAA